MSEGQVVVITGASSGVGRATAREFARQRAKVVLLARGMEGLDASAKEVGALGGDALVVSADVADPEALEAAADEIEAAFGPIDVWVNNAMTSVFSPFSEMDAAEFRRVTEVTYLGVVYGTMAALRRMLPRDRGTVVQVGSALAYRSIPLQSAYCGAKHAIKGFTESLRCELLHGGSGVRMSMVQLPALNTPQFDVVKSRLPKRARPVPPIYQPELAARAIVWAAGHPRREMWVGGTTAATIVANRLLPGLLDRYVAATAYRSQQTDESEDPGRPHNLWEPVPGDRGSHGRFDVRSHARSLQLPVAKHRAWIGLGALVALAMAGRRRAR